LTAGRREQFWTPHGVRLRRASSRPGRRDWLFFPGGPGIGSECLAGLVDGADLPGTSWLVDLPGDGSNVDAPGAPSDPYGLWPGVLSEAVDAVADPVVIGHSTGGADRIVDQLLWRESQYRGRNVDHRVIDGAGHWPWIERPAEVRDALTRFSARLP
jgi:pimeloyl-ACP methyl ester carboxylesterase